MRYGVSKKFRKGIALAVSIALVICTAPSVPVFADETGSTTKIKQVNFGAVNGTAAGVVLSISPAFNKTKNIADGKVGEQNPINGTQWILATESSQDSMDAKVKDNKIILTEGYGEKPSYSSCNIEAEHKQAVNVLNNVTDVASIISKKDGEILYYGNLDKDTSLTSEKSLFKIPAGLEKGNYELYIFAEDNSSKDTSKSVYTSSLGDPVDIEVVSSLKIDITGVDKPEPGKEPDTKAVLKIKKDNKTEEKNIDITWKDELGKEFKEKFAYNRVYYAYADLEDYIKGYIADITSVEVNGEEAIFDSEKSRVTYKYETKQLDNINISGAVGNDNSITLKAYTGITPPAPSAAPEYTYKWYNWKLDTSEPAYTGQSHVLTQDDFDVTIRVELDTSKQSNAASKEISIIGGLLKTSVIEGVTKTDEAIKGKSNGIIEGLKSEMSYSLDGGNTYLPCTTGRLENLAAGTICRVKIEKNNLIPAGVTGIYADYTIGEGSALTVSFDSNGGSGINSIEGIAYNSTIAAPVQPVKEGYIFEGWYNSVNNAKWDFSKDKVTQNISLIAKWNKDQTTEPVDTTKPEGTQTPAPSATAIPDNTTKPEGTQTPAPSATAIPDNTAKPEGTQTPAPSATATPGNTTKPEGTQTPAQTATATPGNTTKPDGTQTPGQATQAPSKNPSSNNNFIPGYVPQVTQQTQAPGQTQVPDGTQAPEQKPSQQPEQEVPGQTQAPEGTQTTAPEPVNNPSQAPSVEDNSGNNNDNNTPDGNTSETLNPVQEDGKIVTGGTEYEISGDGNATISGIITKDQKNIVIPGTVDINGTTYKVTKIEKGAFANSKVQKVEIGTNIKAIEKGAFKNCKKLKTVKFSSKVTTVGQGAFKNCIKLKKVTLPVSVKTIKKNAFKNCKSMKTFTLGTEENNNNEKDGIRKFALRFGTNVAKVSIGASALENCADLRSVVINSQVTKIGNSTFKYCSQLRKMLVKSLKLQKVGNQALKGVNNCKITVPPVKLKPYTTLFKNKGQGKKVVVAKS